VTGISRRGILAGGIGLATLSACSKPGQTPSARSAAAGDELVVGVNLELSGVGATLGKLQEQALRVAAAELNSTGIPFGDKRLPVRLVVRDNGGVPETAGEITGALIEQEKVSAIIGGTTVETAMCMIPVAEPRKVPLLVLCSGDDVSLPLPQRKFIYKLAPNASDVALVLANELRRRQQTTVALLASSDGHGEAGARALPLALGTVNLAHAGTTRLPASGRAFAESARQVVATKAKAVVVWAMAPISAAAVAALRDAGFTGNVFLDAGAGADETLGGPNGPAVDGSYIVASSVLSGAPLVAATPSQRATRDFIYRYIQQYGTFGGFAPYSADALNLLAVAARRGLSLNPQRLRGRLEAGAVEGIAGAYAFQPISHGGIEPDALVLMAARGGSWIRL
jgi:branched-chain amino acid transport system substrate-binding protein